MKLLHLLRLGWMVVPGLALAAASCGTGDQQVDLPEPQAVPVAQAASDRLRQQFPEQAATVLGQGGGFVASDEGFTLIPSNPPEAPRDLELMLPREGTGVARLRVSDDFEVRVREIGAEGEGRVTGNSVAYRRAGGTSFWTTTPAGYDEWLHLSATHREDAAAVWEIEGATVQQRGDEVDVVDETGMPRIRVSAPVAYAVGGEEVAVKLKGEGVRIELYVEGNGEVLVDPVWVAASSLIKSRYGHTETLLLSGKVLVTGGHDHVNYLASTEIYTPSLNPLGGGSWSSAGPMSLKHHHHTATLLKDGRVLVAGGHNLSQGDLKTAELYTPGSGWSKAPPMAHTHEYHTATLLDDHTVLIAGYSTCEVYLPTTNTWWSAGPMLTWRENHTATLLSTGKVLVAGGINNSAGYLKSAELYDPGSMTWTQVQDMKEKRSRHTQVLLLDGRVLVAGGQNSAGVLKTAEIFDPNTNTWTSTASMTSVRRNHTATTLPSGKVLAAGGVIIKEGPTSLQVRKSAELWDPSSNTWTATSDMAKARYIHSATLLGDGSVLMAGGAADSGTSLPNAERYKPNGGPCQANADCETGFCVGLVCCSTACVVANGTPACPSGTCQVDSCDVGYGNCDGLAANGCETALNTAGNCGACGLNCNDGLDCTNDQCDAALGCIHPPSPDGHVCSDGNPCTEADTCQGGSCTPGTPKVCAKLQKCHVPGVCDPASGNCSNPSAPNGTNCDDATNLCTLNDACQDGNCTPGIPKVCPAAGLCKPGACSPPDGACITVNAQNGTNCDDATNLCTLNDTCQGGSCTFGIPKKCPNLSDCKPGVCIPANGTCGIQNLQDGFPCNDGQSCTQGDVCQGGDCQPGAPAPNGVGCSDYDPETSGDRCLGGDCTPTMTCADGKWNQKEQGIDCNGPCPAVCDQVGIMVVGGTSGNAACAEIGRTCIDAFGSDGGDAKCTSFLNGGIALCGGVVGNGASWPFVINGPTFSGGAACALIGHACVLAWDADGFAHACGYLANGGSALCDFCPPGGCVQVGVKLLTATSGNARCAAIGRTCDAAFGPTGPSSSCSSLGNLNGVALCGGVVGHGASWPFVINGPTSSGNAACALIGHLCSVAYDAVGLVHGCAHLSNGGSALCN